MSSDSAWLGHKETMGLASQASMPSPVLGWHATGLIASQKHWVVSSSRCQAFRNVWWSISTTTKWWNWVLGWYENVLTLLISESDIAFGELIVGHEPLISAWITGERETTIWPPNVLALAQGLWDFAGDILFWTTGRWQQQMLWTIIRLLKIHSEGWSGTYPICPSTGW